MSEVKNKKMDLVDLQRNGNGNIFCIVCKRYIKTKEYAFTHNLDINVCCPEHQIIKYQLKPYYAIMKDIAKFVIKD